MTLSLRPNSKRCCHGPVLAAERIAAQKWAEERNRGEGLWEDAQPPAELLDKLRQLLPKNTSWGPVDEYESAAQWGSDLRIWHNDERTRAESICFRYAPVGDPLYVLEDFLDCVADHDLLLLSRETATVMPPEVSAVVEDMKKTRAFDLSPIQRV